MSGAGAVRAGSAYVEIFANDSKFQQAMTRITNRMKAVGSTLRNAGSSMGLTGAAIGAPMVMAIQQAAAFDDAILGMKASTNMTGAELEQLGDKAIEMSKAMGVAPSTVAKAMLALVKAGVQFDQVIGDAGKTAVEFGKLAPEIDMEAAANGMTRASNAFGVGFREIADTVAAAADTTETNVGNIAKAFDVVAPLAASLGQNLSGTTQALAIFAKAGMEAEEGGTALKMFLLSLTNATPQAQEALASLGLTTESFRNQATRNLLPVADIATILMEAIKKVDPAVADAAIATVFGARGIKAMKAFEAAGTQGMAAVAQGMTESKSVAEKFDILMSGITGTIESVKASVERLSGAFTSALGASLQQTAKNIVEWVEWLNQLIERFPALSKETLDVAMNMLTLGLAMRTAGAGLTLLAGIGKGGAAIGGTVAKGLLALGAAPVVAKVAGVAVVVGGLLFLLRQISPTARKGMDDLMKMAGLMEDKKPSGQNAGAKAEVEKAQVNLQDQMTPEERAINEQIAAARMRLTEQSKAIEEVGAAAQKSAADEEQEFADSQQRTIESIRELSNSLVEEVDGLGESAFNAAVNAQGDLQDVMDQVDRGILNSNGAKVLADGIKKQFDADMESLRNANEPVRRDFGQSLGTFGSSGAGLGVGAELFDAVKEVAIGLKERPVRGQGPADPATGEPGYGPNPAWLKKQQQAMQGMKAATDVTKSTDTVSSAVAKMAAEIVKTTEAVALQTPILKQIAKGIESGGLAFS